ncbi:MAG: hypothetical protein WCK76_15210 [Elusimicrobiota bacterium]
MRKHSLCFAAAAVLGTALFCAPARAADESPANALLLIPSEKTAFDARFQDFLNKNGARLTESFPPSAFIGYVPEELDVQLKKKYGVQVYRGKVDDIAEFFKYGETAVLAGNSWNKHFQEDPPSAPIVISHQVNRAGPAKIMLRWNEVMKAVTYRLQISHDNAFRRIALETILPDNSFELCTPFWADGVYYWRVAGELVLNTGQSHEGAFSDTYSFSVSRPAAEARTAAPVLPAAARFKRPALSWPKDPAFKYYRLQVSRDKEFSSPMLDVFTDTETYSVAGLPVARDTPVYMRLMGADETGAGAWSGPSEVILETPAGPPAKGRKPRRRRHDN